MNRFGRSYQGQRRGVALLLTLMVILVLTTLVVDLSYSARVAASVAGNERDSLIAQYLAKSGVQISILRLAIDKLIDKNFGLKDDMNELQWSLPFSYPEGLSLLSGQLSEAGINEKQTSEFMESYNVDGSFQAVVTDESSRINLNAVKWNGNTANGSYLLLQNLLTLKKFKDFFVDQRPQLFIDRLVDWIDEDNQSRDLSGGMENDYYQLQRPPYHAKNGPLFSIDEMRLLREVPAKLVAALADYVTVYPYSTGRFLGTDFGRINVNTASEPVLASIFDRNQVSDPEVIAKKITEIRQKVAFKNKAEFLTALENLYSIPQSAIVAAILPNLEVRSDVFRIESSANVGETEVTINTVIDRSQDKTEYYYWKVN